MTGKDNIVPTGKWKFDEAVTSVFPDMISRSIPGYGTMRESVVRVANRFLNTEQSGQYLLDLGCSRGDTIYDVLDSLDAKVEVGCVGVDSSQEMILAAEELFRDFDNVNFVLGDMTSIEITPGKYTVITSVLTAQFIPLDVRQEFYQNVHKGLSYDGVFIVVEKVLGETPASQGLLVDIYHNYKSEKGYTAEQIEAKRKSLQGVLVPLRASENEAMLKDAGFSNVQRFWQCLNFAGWMATK
jgi:tRNA (cmo5U34)-methyltransferase